MHHELATASSRSGLSGNKSQAANCHPIGVSRMVGKLMKILWCGRATIIPADSATWLSEGTFLSIQSSSGSWVLASGLTNDIYVHLCMLFDTIPRKKLIVQMQPFGIPVRILGEACRSLSFQFVFHLARGRQWCATRLCLGSTAVPNVYKRFATGRRVSAFHLRGLTETMAGDQRTGRSETIAGRPRCAAPLVHMRVGPQSACGKYNYGKPTVSGTWEKGYPFVKDPGPHQQNLCLYMRHAGCHSRFLHPGVVRRFQAAALYPNTPRIGVWSCYVPGNAEVQAKFPLGDRNRIRRHAFTPKTPETIELLMVYPLFRRSMRLWNSLPTTVAEENDFHKFDRALNDYLPPPISRKKPLAMRLTRVSAK